MPLRNCAIANALMKNVFNEFFSPLQSSISQWMHWQKNLILEIRGQIPQTAIISNKTPEASSIRFEFFNLKNWMAKVRRRLTSAWRHNQWFLPLDNFSAFLIAHHRKYSTRPPNWRYYAFSMNLNGQKNKLQNIDKKKFKMIHIRMSTGANSIHLMHNTQKNK